jgi:hypothetical protein
MPPLAFDALEPIEKRIRQVRADVGYITLHEVLDRVKCENLGRVDFTETDLAPYAFDPAPAEFEEAGVLGDLGDTPPLDEALRFADAACRWVRETVTQNMHGQEEGKFRIFVWRPKGEQVLFTARFGCTDPHYNPDAARPGTAVVVATAPELAATIQRTPQMVVAQEALPEGRVWAALGAGYTQLIELAQKSYAHLATLQNTTIGNQNTQILRLQKVIEELVGEHIKMRAGIVEADSTRRTEGEESRVREELGKQFITEIGTFGRVVAAAKFGMAPELVELAELVNASPELTEAMKAPEVRKMLRDEKTRKELAELLLMAAKSAAPAPPTDQSAAA